MRRSTNKTIEIIAAIILLLGIGFICFRHFRPESGAAFKSLAPLLVLAFAALVAELFIRKKTKK